MSFDTSKTAFSFLHESLSSNFGTRAGKPCDRSNSGCVIVVVLFWLVKVLSHYNYVVGIHKSPLIVPRGSFLWVAKGKHYPAEDSASNGLLRWLGLAYLNAELEICVSVRILILYLFVRHSSFVVYYLLCTSGGSCKAKSNLFLIPLFPTSFVRHRLTPCHR